MHNKLIPTNEKLVNKQKNNLLYEEIINSDLKNILVLKEEQENLIDFLKKRKQIGENYLQIDLLHLLDDKQTFDEQGIENNIISCLNLQEKILPVAWDKKKIWKKWGRKFLKLVPVALLVCLVLTLFLEPYIRYGTMSRYTIISSLIVSIFLSILYLIVSPLISMLTNSFVRLKHKKKLWKRLKGRFELDSIKPTIGHQNVASLEFNLRPSKLGKKQTFIQYLIKELIIGKTSVILLDLDNYPPSYLSNLSIWFKNIDKNYDKTSNKKLTFFYLTSKDLNEYNGFDFYIYPIPKTNELALKRTLKSDYELVNTLFSNFKNKFNLPIYEDTYSFLIDYKKFYKTYKNHFSLKEFFVILILKKYFYKYLWFLITNNEESNNTIDLPTFKTIINLEKVDSIESLASNSYNNIWEWAYSNSFFQIESANSIDFYSIFFNFFVIKLHKFTDLNDKCSCLEKYGFVLDKIINNKLTPCIENKITDKCLKLFIQENIGVDEKYNNFVNRVKKVAENPGFSNNLLDSKDNYYEHVIDLIDYYIWKSEFDIYKLKNIYENTLIKYHTNNNDHYIFILASFLNQIFKSKEIKTKLVKRIILDVLWLAKSNYYLKLKKIFFILDYELQVYIVEIITKEWLNESFVNDWLTVFSKNERQVFGILLKHYCYKKRGIKFWKSNFWKEKRFRGIEYYNLEEFKTLWLLNKKADKFGLFEWFESYHCKEKTTK